MIRHLSARLKLLGVLLIALLSPFAVNAQQSLAAVPLPDSASVHNTLLGGGNGVKGKKAQRQQLLELLKNLNVADAPYNTSEDKQWSQMATLFTRLRLYPLAMKCFLKTLAPDSVVNDDLPFSGSDERSVADRLKRIGYATRPLKSKIIKVNQILETFRDGKQALAYAMILHVKQPVRGTPKVHKFINTGHTFITLIKFNTDSSYATLSFGFGPHKDNLLAATPLIPSSSSKFTDDGGHGWDEVIGKFISKRRFEKILQLTRQYDGLGYNLSTNNCTDFGLKAAELAGLQVRDTRATWPLGAGNNPGTAGESILLGKFSNVDNGSLERLFIDTALYAPTVNKIH